VTERSDTRPADPELTVYYDGACPRCVYERARYERLSGDHGEKVEWMDITGRDKELEDLGIDPDHAMRELHVRDREGRVHREMDAYIVLMRRVTLMKPLAWLLCLPGIRGVTSRLYRAWVLRRLRRAGRIDDSR
jgi:predicted DCC family thiol-disulfide oxidoreductase YuxK